MVIDEDMKLEAEALKLEGREDVILSIKSLEHYQSAKHHKPPCQ